MMITKQALENRTVRFLSNRYKIEINKFKTNVNHSKPHEGLKKRVLNWLVKHGYNVVCEARFKGKLGRGDLLILNPPICLEIMVSETEERLSSKKYPVKTIGIKKIKEVKELFQNKTFI